MKKTHIQISQCNKEERTASPVKSESVEES